MAFQPRSLGSVGKLSHTDLSSPYRQPHPLEEDGPQHVALAAGSQQETCSAGEQQEGGVLVCEVCSGGCLGEGSSLTWDVLSVSIGGWFIGWLLSLRETSSRVTHSERRAGKEKDARPRLFPFALQNGLRSRSRTVLRRRIRKASWSEVCSKTR